LVPRLHSQQSMKQHGVFGGSLFLLSALACGGATDTVLDARAVDGGSSGLDGSALKPDVVIVDPPVDAGPVCKLGVLPGNRACVPGTAVANQPIEIEISSSESCLGCGVTLEPCKVTRAGSKITVSLVSKTCPFPSDMACPPVCEIPQTKCTLPALPAGAYVVEVVGELPGSSLPPRALVVANKATDSSCSFPKDRYSTSTFATSYGANCASDADCALVTLGDTCQPCSCPNAAIANTSLSTYQEDFRRLRSLCTTSNSGPVCAACIAPKAVCDKSGGAAGMCKTRPN
jgi:hypothetical protein